MRGGEIVGHRRRLRQRPEGVAGGAVGRAHCSTMPLRSMLSGTPAGRLDAARAARAGSRVRARGAPRARRGSGDVAGRQRAADRASRRHAARTGSSASRRGRARSRAADRSPGSTSRLRGPELIARSLSGGNLQKFIVGREILQDPQVMIARAADLGRRRRRIGADPAGADRLARRRRRGPGGVRRARRAVRNLRPDRGDRASGRLSAARPRARPTPRRSAR